MAETSAWTAHAARLNDARRIEEFEQLLRGPVAGSFGNQQRSMSSGRHPRLGANTNLHGQLQAAAGSLYGGLEGAHQSIGQSPRPRSASVGRRHLQDMHELVNVMNELTSKGHEIKNLSRHSQDGAAVSLRRSAEGRPPSASVGGATAAAPAAAAVPVSAGRGSGTNFGGGGPVAMSSIAAGLRGGPVGPGVVVSSKGVARSILGGVESLTTKLEMLGGRLTPRKGSPRGDHHRDTSVGRRNASSNADGPNYRDMLAELNAGLLQGSRDQRPSASSIAAPLGQGSRLGLDSASLRKSVGGISGGTVPGPYGGTAATDFAASLILANRHQRSEDVEATERRLLDLQAVIRGASSGGGGGGSGVGAGGGGAVAAVSDAAATAAAAASAAAGNASVSAGGAGGMEAAPSRSSGGPPRRRGNSATAAATGSGGVMLQSFLASLSEALPVPPTPAVRSAAADAEPARPVAPMHGDSGGAPVPPSVPRAHYHTSGSAASSPRSAAGGGGSGAATRASQQPPHHQQQPQQQQQQQLTRHELQLHRSQHHPQQQQQLHNHPRQLSHPPHPQSQPHTQQQQLRHDRSHGQPSGGQLAGLELQAERSTTGGASVTTLEFESALDQRLGELNRLTATLRSGLVTPEAESSLGSSGGGGTEAATVAAALLGSGRRGGGGGGERRQEAATSAASSLRRDGGGAPVASVPLRPRAAWADDAAAAAVLGSGWAASTAGPVAGSPAAVPPPSARNDGNRAAPQRSAGGGSLDAAGGSLLLLGSGRERVNLMMAGYAPAPPLPRQQPAGGSASTGQGPEAPPGGPSAWMEEGLHMAMLLQQRRKERARRGEQGVAEAAAAASRARQDAADLQAQHDLLMTRYLAERQRVELLEAELERTSKEGCANCARRRDQLQQLSDLAANSAAQLRELQSQLQDARAREEVMRRQLDHATGSMSDQAAAGARLRTTFELALQEFLNMLETAAGAAALPPGLAGSSSGSGRNGGDGGSTAGSVASVSIGRSTCGHHHHSHQQGGGVGSGSDVESLIDAVRSRLREQGELARRQREMLEAAESKVAEERSAGVAAREAASSERAGALALATQQASFQRERAESLQEELARQRELMSKLEMRVRQVEDERERVVRQRDAVELSLQAQQAQLEAAAQQQDTLVGRLYDGQRAREDAEVLQAQIRSLERKLEEARAAASRSEALERRAAEEREARDELDAQLAALQSQLGEREAALEGSRRRVRELEAAANSAVASRQVAIEEISNRSEEVRTLSTENARMFHLLDRLQQEKRGTDGEIQKLSAQVLTLQQEAAALRVELATAREQLAAAKDGSGVRDATLAQHQLSADLAAARSEAAALRAAHEAAGEYAQAMARTLRRHGLTPPEPPSSADVTSQIGDLQTKLAAESGALAVSRTEVSELRQQLVDARSEMDRLKRESQSLTDRYSQLEAAHAAAQASWQHSAGLDAAQLHALQVERDALERRVHSLQLAGDQDADELRRKLTRLEVQVESLTGSKREVEERARVLTQDLGALRKALGDKEALMEAMRLALEDAKEAASQAAKLQFQAEAAVAQAERARLVAEAEADKARAAVEVERARATAVAEADKARAREEAARSAEKAEAEKLAAAVEKEREAARSAEKADAEKLAAEITRLQGEVDRLEKELADRNAEYAGLYDYCGQVIGERDTAAEEREAFSASAAAAAAEVAALRQELEELREELADKEQRLAVKPRMAELQYRINELTAQVTDLTAERDTAAAENNSLTQKLQEETEAHYQTDGRRVRLGEEVERLRGILRMYSIPF